MKGIATPWKTATIAENAKVSDVVKMEGHYDHVIVIVPDLTTDDGVAIQVSDAYAGTYVELYGLYLATPADLALPKQKACVVRIQGAEFLKFTCATNQGEDREILVRGL